MYEWDKEEFREIPMTDKVVIFDIDGTLADTTHRLHYIYPPAGQKKNWGKFFAEAKNDPLIPHVAELVRMYRIRGHIPYLVTGRPESMRADTEEWLLNHGIRYSMLLMRPLGDHRPDYIVKEEIIKPHFDPEDVICAYEDRLHVAEMWRKLGIPVMLCNDEWRDTKVSNESVEVVK